MQGIYNMQFFIMSEHGEQTFYFDQFYNFLYLIREVSAQGVQTNLHEKHEGIWARDWFS
jgi:hypothetical protein